MNSTSWTVITNSLGAGTTSTVIPSSSFAPGVNTFQFKESNSLSTKFEWTLYINQGAMPQEYLSSFSYDTYGNMTSFTDAEGNTALYEHDPNHIYLASITNALDQAIEVTYNFNTGLLTSVTDPKGATTSYEYDIVGRVTRRIHPDLTEVEAVYDDQNVCVTIYDELDHKTVNYYDGLGRLTRIEKYLSPTSRLTETYTYNYMNKIETHTDPKGYLYSREYDSKGRPTKIIDPGLTFKEIQYDDNLNIISFFDELGHKRVYKRNWVGNLLWVKEYKDPYCYLTEYTYDDMGNMTSLTDANQNTTYYEYGSYFGLTRTIYPDLTTETFSYDAVGNVLQKMDSNGTTTFTHNATYQLVSIQYPDQSSISFEYDPNGNRIAMTGSGQTTSWTYDNRNRILSETSLIEGELYTVGYQYDAASRLTSLTYPDQSVITYEYDALNQLVTIPEYAEFTYNSNSLLETMTYNNGVMTTYYYDNCSRTVNVHAQKNDIDLLLMSYQYDAGGNITQSSYGRRLPDQQWVESQEVFQYDCLNRLTSAQGDYGSLTYTFDPVGNRLSQNEVTYTYSSMNELLSASDGSVLAYDENGNLITKSDGTNSWSYTYDVRNLLMQVEKNQQVVAQYSYDGDGKRTKKTEWVESLQEYQTTIYVYSGANVIYEKNLNTGTHANYIFSSTGRIAKNVGETTVYYHADRLGSTRLVTDESGNVIAEATYSPFGEGTVNGEESHLFTGKEKDTTGLYYFGSRYYDPEIGRFMTRDAVKGDVKNPQSLNLYSYCLNNPLRYIDPLGFDEKSPEDVVNEIFQHLFNISLDQLGLDLESYFQDEEGNPLSTLEGLEKLVKALGFECEMDTERQMLQVTIEIDGRSEDIMLYDSAGSEEYEGFDHYGMAPPGTNDVVVNVSNHATVADLAATILHEICHRALETACPEMRACEHHKYILPAHVEVINKLMEGGRKTPNYRSPSYPFSEKYVEDQIQNLELFGSQECPESGACLGSVVLNILILMGLFLKRTFRKDRYCSSINNLKYATATNQKMKNRFYSYWVIILLAFMVLCIGQDTCDSSRCGYVCRGKDLWKQECFRGKCTDHTIVEEASAKCAQDSSRAEEYAVLTVLIKTAHHSVECMVPDFDEAQMITIVDHTSWYVTPTYDMNKLLQYVSQEMPEVEQTTLKDFQTKNAQSYLLGYFFDFSIPVVLVSQEEREEIARNFTGWEDFYAKYPSSQGLITLSRVGFNSEKNQALVYIGYGFNRAYGGGNYVLLIKENGIWRIQDAVLVWIT